MIARSTLGSQGSASPPARAISRPIRDLALLRRPAAGATLPVPDRPAATTQEEIMTVTRTPTAEPATRPQHRHRRVRDVRRFSRYAAAAVMLVPATSVAVGRLFQTDDSDTRAALDLIAQNPDRQFTFALLGYIGLLTVVPAFLGAARLARRRRPVLTTVAITVNLAAYLGSFAMGAIDSLYLVGAQLPPEQRDAAAAVIDQMWSAGLAGFSTTLFVLGHIVGAILMGLALRGSIPTLGWLAMLSTTPVHVLAFVVLQLPALDLAAWLLMTVSFAFCAVRIIRTPDDEWDLPPLGAGARA